jgi:hypothetical protein
VVHWLASQVGFSFCVVFVVLGVALHRSLTHFRFSTTLQKCDQNNNSTLNHAHNTSRCGFLCKQPTKGNAHKRFENGKQQNVDTYARLTEVNCRQIIRGNCCRRSGQRCQACARGEGRVWKPRCLRYQLWPQDPGGACFLGGAATFAATNTRSARKNRRKMRRITREQRQQRRQYPTPLTCSRSWSLSRKISLLSFDI